MKFIGVPTIKKACEILTPSFVKQELTYDFVNIHVNFERLQGFGGFLYHLQLLDDLLLDLLPLGLSVGVGDGHQQPGDLLYDSGIIDDRGFIIASQCRLPGQFGVLANFVDGNSHVSFLFGREFDLILVCQKFFLKKPLLYNTNFQ